MADYRKMYHIMFNAATDAERLACEASDILRKAQFECERLYLEASDAPIDLQAFITIKYMNGVNEDEHDH